MRECLRRWRTGPLSIGRQRAAPRASSAGALLAAVSALALGCGANDDEFTGEEGEVAAVIERYQEALEERDIATICGELLAPRSFPHPGAGPERCERVFQAQGNRGVAQAVQLEIGSISIEGSWALASYAKGEGFTELINKNGRWYLSGSPK